MKFYKKQKELSFFIPISYVQDGFNGTKWVWGIDVAIRLNRKDLHGRRFGKSTFSYDGVPYNTFSLLIIDILWSHGHEQRA